MCFSARMSFFAVGLLLSVAVATYRKIRTQKQFLLASMPLLFALQQTAEGVLWILLPTGNYPILGSIAKYTFLTFAFAIWPVYIPLTVLLLEKTDLRRALISVCFVIGLGWSLASLWYLAHHGALAQIESCHIYYELIGLSADRIVRVTIYCIATVVPFLLSSHRALQILGIVLGLFCALSYFVWYNYFVSVWCFFAALISLAVYYIVSKPELLD